MNPLTRTFAYVAVAGVSVIAASSAWYASKPSVVSGYGEVGQEFFEEFTDPTKATALSVVDYDEEAKDVQTFSVKQGDVGLWVIPSHHNYPAEASERLAKTATSLLGVRKVAVQSRSKDDWKSYGVVSPDAEGAATGEERGTRMTLRDGSGNALVDLIVGNEVEGRDGHYFVREPEKDTTYIAKLNVDLSARFSDWIEPDLLKVNESDIVAITVDNYSIDEQRGTVDKKELLTFRKKDLATSGDWTLQGLTEDSETLDSSPVRTIATNLDRLKIVGVRPKPEGLDDNLRINPLIKQVLQQQMQALGYFIGGDREGNERLYSNEGELIAGINNGVEYTLYFGEIARGTGKEIEIGLGDAAQETKADDTPDAEKKDGEEASEDKPDDGPRRYLLVKVGFKEELLGKKPVAPTEPIKPEILKDAAPKDSPATKPSDKEDADKKEDEAPKADTEKPEAEAEKKADSDAECADEESSPEETKDAPSDEKPADAPITDESKPDVKTATETPEQPQKQEAPVGKEATSETPATEAKTPETTKPAEEAKPETADETPKADPKQVAQQEYDAAMGKYEAELKAYEGDIRKYEEKIKTGKEKAEELSRRFAGWYYVISSDSFEKFRIERKDVVSKKEAKDEAASDATKQEPQN